MKRFILLFTLTMGLLLLAPQKSSAQKGKVSFADQLYERFDFRSAQRLYQKVYDNGSEDPYVIQRLAQCHEHLREPGKAEPYYRQLVEDFPDFPFYQFKLAQSIMAQGRTEEAFGYLRSYADLKGGYSTLPKSYNASYLDSDPSVTVKREDFNTKELDYSPMIIMNRLYFISTRGTSWRQDDMDYERGAFADIYYLNTDSADSKPRIFGKEGVSGDYHEGQVCHDPIYNDMYITRNVYRGKDEDVEEDDKDRVHLKIYKLPYLEKEERFGKTLSDPVDFNSENYSTAFPAITNDGKYMFFASNKDGGFGGMDLYIAKRVDGRWTEAVNLGPEVNTPGDDTYPYVAADGTLYFASEGHLGYGGLDIYKMPLNEDGSYGYPENMRSPINSGADDYGITFTSEMDRGYFTSNRANEETAEADDQKEASFQDDDIYSFIIEGIQLDLCVFEDESGNPIDSAYVTLINLDDGTQRTKLTGPDCKQMFGILPNTNYKLEVFKEGYLPEEAEFTSGEEDITAEIPLIPDYGLILDVLVTDMINGAILPGADVTLVNKVTGEKVPKKTGDDGKTFFVLEEDQQYEIVTNKETDDCCVLYLLDTRSFSTMGIESPATLTQEIPLDRLGCGDIRVVPIYYDLDESYIRADAALVLDELVQLLLDNPSIEIEMASHTDCRASKSYNRRLSAARAESAVAYLIENGVAFNRLTAAGYGETKLVNDCPCEGGVGRGRTSACTEQMHQENRRTEFKVTRLKPDCY